VKKKVGNEPLPAEGLIGSETMPLYFPPWVSSTRASMAHLEQFAKVSVKNHITPPSDRIHVQKETPLEEVPILARVLETHGGKYSRHGFRPDQALSRQGSLPTFFFTIMPGAIFSTPTLNTGP